MDTSYSSSKGWRSRYSQCDCAGTICLLGIGCRHTAGTLRIQNDILPVRLHIQEDSSKVRTVDAWKKLAASAVPTEAKQGKQKWDNIVVKNIAKELLDNASGPLNQARLRAAAAPHSGDWLLAPPVTALGYK